MGMIMEFTTPEYWVVGLAARVAFPPKALEGLDPLSRELLERRPSVIEIEIGRLLNKAEKPGDVLKLLAQYNQWSIHVTEPKIAQLDERTRKTDSIEKMAQHYAFVLYQRGLTEEVVAQPRALKKSAATRKGLPAPKVAVPEDTTPAWMIPPLLWTQPRLKTKA